MKVKKRILRISLIVVVLMLLLSMLKMSNASILGAGMVIGFEAIMVVIVQEVALLLGMTFNTIFTAIAGKGKELNYNVLADIIFNKCEGVRANFFPDLLGGNPSIAMAQITESIGKYYVIIRNLSIAVLLGILLYIGIRMAISTVASEEAKYKKMLTNWVVSLALVFVLHFIIIVTFYVNDVLVQALSKTLAQTGPMDYDVIAKAAAVPIVGLPETIIYLSLCTCTLVFALMYIKRIITLGFLIVIAPLITITYSIDKIGDGKSQALNTWLKEFIFTVMIQPFHCIIYIVFVQTAFNLVNANHDLASEVLALMSVFFMLKAEGLVKKIFGIRADSMADALAMGAQTVGVLSGLLKGGVKSISAGKGKMPKMKGNSGVNTVANKGGAQNNQNQPSGKNGGNSSGQNGGNNGSGGGNPTSSNNNPSSSSNNGGGASSGTTNPASNQPKSHKIAKAIKKATIGDNPFKEAVQHYQRKGGLAGLAGREAANVATLVGAAMGATVGDASTAVSTAMAGRKFAGGLEGKLIDMQNQNQLDDNQKVFAGAYEDFARECRRQYGEDLSDESVWALAEELYNRGGIDIDSGSQYELDFYNQMEQLADSAEIMGYSDGFDYVKDSMRLTSAGKIDLPGDYIPTYYQEPTITYEDLVSSINSHPTAAEVNNARIHYGTTLQEVENSFMAGASSRNREMADAYEQLRNLMIQHSGNDQYKQMLLDKKAELDTKYLNP